jgi:signal peptidase I
MENNPQKRGRIWRLMKSFGSTLLFVWLFTNHFAQATVVPTESMKPTILVGDHFFLDKVAFPANYPEALQKFLPVRTIERGDIVALWSPEDRNIRLVKRVIGLPGESLEIRNRNVFINGVKLNEPYVIYMDSQSDVPRRDNLGPITIPSGRFFLMGDNRDRSNDSRFWGFARREDVIGKPLFVYWSYSGEQYVATDWNLIQSAKHYGSVAVHFFTRTRWFRTGTIVR